MPRVLVEAVAETPLGPVRLMTTHLEYSSPVLRAAQVEGIREAHRMAASRAGTPRAPGPHTYAPTPNTASAILTGDFNMRPDDPALARLMAPFEDGTPPLRDLWPAVMGDAPPPPTAFIVDQTYGPPGCLDYVLATPISRPAPAASSAMSTRAPRTTSRSWSSSMAVECRPASAR